MSEKKREAKHNRDPQKEFFAKKEAEKLAEDLYRFIDLWGHGGYTDSSLSVVLRNARRNRLAFESMIYSSHSINQALEFIGEQEEMIQMQIPLARTRIRQFVSYMSKKKLTFEAITDVSDADPLQTARLAKSICDTVTKNQRLQEKSELISERMLVEGTCFASCLWRDDKGVIVTGMEDPTALDGGGGLSYEGDVSINIHELQDVFFDWSASSWDEVPWCTIRVPMQRWDLISQFPELEDEILDLPSYSYSVYYKHSQRSEEYNETLDPIIEDNKVAVYHFFYKPSSALPFGRYTIFGENSVIFYDSPEMNVYQGLPVTPFFVDQIQGCTLGYPLFSNLLPSQEVLDATFSSLATNIQAFSTPNVMVPKGSDINVNDLNKMRVIQYTPMSNVDGGGRPENLNLTNVPNDLYNLVNLLEKEITDASMINDTLRGSPAPNITSGVMAATLSSNALEFVNVASQRLYLGLEFLMNKCIEVYKTFASVERLVEISGLSNMSYVRTFKGEDLSALKQIRIQESNPLLSTTAGRLSISDGLLQLMQQQKPELVQKYLMILEGAPVSELYESDISEATAVQMEIDAILEGKEVNPLITDNHPLYINAYKKLLYNPLVRERSNILPVVLSLIEKRLELERQLDPTIKAILRGEPIPPPQQPQQGGQTRSGVQPPVASPSNIASSNVPPGVAKPTAKPAQPGDLRGGGV